MQYKLLKLLSSFPYFEVFVNKEFFYYFGKMKKIKSLFDSLPKRQRVYNTAYHRMAHYIYPKGETEKIKVEHFQPESFRDWVAYKFIRAIRWTYDFLTAYDIQRMTVTKWIQRCILLETVAGVPGMVGGMARHLKSIRDLRRDKGWIHHLLEQADNERFHLFIFLKLKEPGFFQRLYILAMQGAFFNVLFISYLLSPRFSHRFVGYLEQEAVKTYTAMLEDIDSPNGVLREWSTIKAPIECRNYYELEKDATLRDLILCIRADEASHRGTNHYLASANQHAQIEEQFVKVVNRQKSTVEDAQEQQQLRIKIQEEIRRQKQDKRRKQ